MVKKQETVVVTGRRHAKNKLIHAVYVLKTTDRDGTRLSEPPMLAICGASLGILDYSQPAEQVFQKRCSGLCRACEDAMRWSREAREAAAVSGSLP